MEGIPEPGPLPEPEPPPSLETDNLWVEDVLHNVNDTTIPTIKSTLQSRTNVPHPFQNSDFCLLCECQCKDNCTDHWSLTPEPKIPTPTIKTASKHSQQKDSAINTTLDVLHDKMKLDNIQLPIHHKVQILRSQNDIGANTSVTNNKNALLLYQQIPPLHTNGVQEGDPAITCTGKGYIPWTSRENHTLLVPTYYCSQADGTIISPNSVQHLYNKMFKGFHMFCDCDDKTGHLNFYHRDGINHATYDAHSLNNLWYHDIPTNSNTCTHSHNYIDPRINKLNKTAKHELWHQRLIHPGERCMCTIHNYVDGIDEKLTGNSFYRCAACMQGKPKKSDSGKPQFSRNTRKRTNKHKDRTSKPILISAKEIPTTNEEIDDIFIPNAQPGQHFHMDFGFVRGSTYAIKKENGPTITSKDGYNSYLLIVDRATRYMWLFLTASKHPPVETARKVLHKFKSSHPHRTVRTDQGKELGKSDKFRAMVEDEGFVLELTGAEASSQNGLAESPNRVLAQMMRCALYSADLGPEYWSYALRQAVYVKNRLPHTSIKNTPYERLTGKRPDVSRLRIFGARVCARMPGADKFPKLDHKNTNGIFLGYTATDKNIYFEDDITGRILISKHVLFDEAHLSIPSNSTPLGAQALHRTGYSPEILRTELHQYSSKFCLTMQLNLHSQLVPPSEPTYIAHLKQILLSLLTAGHNLSAQTLLWNPHQVHISGLHPEVDSHSRTTFMSLVEL